MSTPRALAADLIAWFEANRRDLPWRRTGDPYAIWVSEIMLQQTQVATVTPYYERFMALFPTVATLASAHDDAVLKAWEGLGYYSRARHLLAGARLVAEHHHGVMPATWDAVRRLPGVGDYTAGAILSIAHGHAVPAVDGNVMRVLSRIHLVMDDISRPITRRLLNTLALELVSAAAPGRAGDLNQALMELGAVVCLPARPRCGDCPVAKHCRAQAAGEAEALPIKAKKQAPRAVTLAVAVVAREDRLLLARRPERGIWGGLWAFPAVECVDTGLDPRLGAPDPAIARTLAEDLARQGLTVELGPLWQVLTHSLTHRQLTIPVYKARHRAGEWVGDRLAWVLPAELADYALPVPFQKIARALDPGPLFHGATRA